MKSSRNIRVEVLIALISALVVFTYSFKNLGHSLSRAPEIFKESGVVNLTTSVYLFQRAYDTIFEVLVFSLVVVGISIPRGVKGERITDKVYTSVSNFMGFFIAISSIYLAATGHIYPGGGFTAGVVGGTSLLLMGISRGVEKFEREFERFQIPAVEKILLGVIVAVSILTMTFNEKSLIPLENFLIYFKVMAGTWIITREFIRHRGII